MYKTASLARAGHWFLESGIQEPSGGVARFYQSDISQNKPVSTEITGYTASTLVYLFDITGEEIYLDRARKTARFLMDRAWNPELRTFPYEYPSPSAQSLHRAYFFDCGIIIRGLLAVWHFTREEELLDVARKAAHGMIVDFRTGGDYHPILELPEKEPLLRNSHWSRSAGCYQLKSAMAWLDISELTGDEPFLAAYYELLDISLSTYRSFLPAATLHATMDRLHAACYFLEALTPVLGRPECAEAYAAMLTSVAQNYREISPSFARCDVLAQLLRARIFGAAFAPSLMPLAKEDGIAEAEALARFQLTSDDPRIDGGFVFATRDGVPSSHVSPVSSGFALQALQMWHGFQAGQKPPCRQVLI